MNANPSFAIVTPTYTPDLSRCELLCRSLDHCAPDVTHYLILDRRDHKTFAHLASGRRHIVISEDVIGSVFWRTPGMNGFWLSLRTPPARGWIAQQIKKIAATRIVTEDVMVMCDSDTVFRRFGLADFLVNERLGLLDIGYANDSTRRWIERSKKLLGSDRLSSNRSYVGALVCWQRSLVQRMQARVAEATGVAWEVAIARSRSFSEYTLYGAFVRDVLGYDHTDHAPSDVPLIKPAWGKEFDSDEALDRFFAEFDPRTIGVMIHSKDGIDPARYTRHLERLWAKL
jgi:hypothetical protein